MLSIYFLVNLFLDAVHQDPVLKNWV